jgi:signal transduction histidine kinase
MRRASIFAGVPFRSALLFLAVFAVVLGITGFAILRATQEAVTDQVRSNITEDFQLLRDADITGGQQELVKFIRDAVATRSEKQFSFGVFRSNGRRIAGNIDASPGFRGWGVLPRQQGQDGGDPRFIAYVDTIDDDIVVVGRSARFAGTIGNAILDELIIAGIVICLSALGIGWFLSRGVSRKLDVIDRTLDRVSRGNSEARLPIGTSNDQIDHVSRQINAHLDRLSDFMAAMRNTIVAIAHDLKSPLNRAFILLQDASNAAAPGSPEAERLDRAMGEMDTLRGILDTVLRISRIESSADASNFVPFSSALLVRDLAQTFEPVLEAAGQRLRLAEPDGEGAPIFGDRQMVAQMLVNLIENASRYSGNGTIIDLAVRSERGGAVITIADNGPGIPADRRDEVFRPFRRLNPERNSPGAGLGLALVKAVAIRHHADVLLSDNHPGLKVTVCFPPMQSPFPALGNLTPMYSSRQSEANSAG